MRLLPRVIESARKLLARVSGKDLDSAAQGMPSPVRCSGGPERSPKASVVLITHNQEQFCCQALQSILDQAADFDIEIIIADDASTDRTVAMLSDLAGDRPGIRFLPQERRLGTTRNYRRAFESCRGEYVAVLEGDDYWTAPAKLADQIAVLDAHKDLGMVFSPMVVRHEGSGRTSIRPTIDPARLIDGIAHIGPADLARSNIIGNFSACVYRRSTIAQIPPEFYQSTAFDWLFNIYCGEIAAIGCLPGVRSVYRQHKGGQWSRLHRADKLRLTISAINRYDRLTQRRYHTEFMLHKARLEAQLRAVRRRTGWNLKRAKGGLGDVLVWSFSRFFR